MLPRACIVVKPPLRRLPSLWSMKLSSVVFLGGWAFALASFFVPQPGAQSGVDRSAAIRASVSGATADARAVRRGQMIASRISGGCDGGAAPV